MPAGKRVVFVVNGNVTKSIFSVVTRLDGFFLVNGIFDLIVNLGSNQRLTVNGGVAAFGEISCLAGGGLRSICLSRDLGSVAANLAEPVEIFNYDPGYLYLFAREDTNFKFSFLGDDSSSTKEIAP